MKFRYKKYAPEVVRPVIPIEVVYNAITVPYEVLVDSGADQCIFDAQLAEILGIDVESGTVYKVSGVTGDHRLCYSHKLEIKVGGWPFTITANFMRDIPTVGYGIVGQKGFFDIFIVKFDLLKEEIELKEHSN